MKRTTLLFGLLIFGVLSGAARAQVPPVESPDPLSMLKSDDPKLAKNKKLCSISGASSTKAGTWMKHRSTWPRPTSSTTRT